MENGLLPCELLKKHPERKTQMLKGSPKKYWTNNAVQMIVMCLMLGVGVGIVILLAGMIFFSIFNSNVQDAAKAVASARTCFIVAAVLVTAADTLLFFLVLPDKIKRAVELSPNYNHLIAMERDLTDPLLADFGQSKYDLGYARKMRKKILIFGIPIAVCIGVPLLFLKLPIKPEYYLGKLVHPDNLAFGYMGLKCLGAGLINSVLWLVKFYYRDPIVKLICPQCRYLNTFLFGGKREAGSYHYDTKIGSTKGGEYKSKSIYIDGKEVGGVYEEYSGWDTFEYGTAVTTDNYYYCQVCGRRETLQTTQYNAEGTRTKLNGQ